MFVSYLNKIYLKLFLVFGVPCAFGMWAFSIANGEPYSWQKFVLSVVYFGTLWTLFQIISTSGEIKRLGLKKLNVKESNKFQNISFKSTLDLDQICKSIQESDLKNKVSIKKEPNLISVRYLENIMHESTFIKIYKSNDKEDLIQINNDTKNLFGNNLQDFYKNSIIIKQLQKIITAYNSSY